MPPLFAKSGNCCPMPIIEPDFNVSKTHCNSIHARGDLPPSVVLHHTIQLVRATFPSAPLAEVYWLLFKRDRSGDLDLAPTVQEACTVQVDD